MKGQLNSWTMYIPGVSNTPEVAELKKFQEIIKCMTDTELDSAEANLSGIFLSLNFFHFLSSSSTTIIIIVHTYVNLDRRCKTTYCKGEYKIYR